jgi:protein-S-isoprenylcysteine O-methyltransferase Ste14
MIRVRGMEPLFTHEPLIWVVVGASLTFWHFVEVRLGGRESAKGRNASDPSLLMIGVLMLASLVGAIFASAAHLAPIAGGSWWPVVVGLVMIWGGLAFRAWSIYTLGRFFKLTVVIQDDHRVIETGPYRVLRHPSYLGSIVAMTGVGFTEGDWVSVAIMLLGTLTAFVIRIRIEERTLLQELGSEYAAYSQRTARLLPGVY